MSKILANGGWWQLGLIGLVVSSAVSTTNPAFAQLTPDGTLGAESSVITPNVNIKGSLGDRIDGGAVRGTNLFHSFSEFNVSNGGRVYFANPAGIENILTRVTGNNASSILGTLGVNGNANLFLINPNGIIFGENARLDIPGSFFASTASALNFGNGHQFSATNPEAPPLLTINVQPGVQYNHSQPAAIVNRGNLEVGQNLTLAASNLDLSGQLLAGWNLTLQATDTLRIRDTTTVPFIASAGGKMEVEGNAVDIFALNHRDSGFYSGSDMTFRSANTVSGDAHYWSGGNFRIEKLDGSLGNLYSPYDPVVLASGNVSLGNYTGASLHILAGGEVTINNVNIISTDTVGNTINPLNTILFNGTKTFADLASFSLSDGSQITIDGTNYPTLDIRAGVDWSTLGGIPLPNPKIADSNSWLSTLPTYPVTPLNSNITVNGTISLTSPNGIVLLTNQYHSNPLLSNGKIQLGSIDTTNFFGNSGSVIIDSKEDISINGLVDTSTFSINNNAGNITLIAQNTINATNSQILAETYGNGKAGNINFSSKQLLLQNGTIVSTTTEGAGVGGDINLNASDSLTVIGGTSTSFIIANALDTGNAGNLTITTKYLKLKDGATLSSTTTDSGKGGNITLNAIDGLIELTDSQIYLLAKGSGSGGNLALKTGVLTLNDSSYISTATTSGLANFTQAQGGSININATESMQLNNSALYLATTGTGNAGNLILNTPHFQMLGGADIGTQSLGAGKAGNININVSKLIEMRGDSNGTSVNGITSGASSSGSAGNITINTEKLIMKYGAIINSSALSSNAIAGDLNVAATNLVVQDGSFMASVTFGGGKAGNILVKADNSVEISGASIYGVPSAIVSDTLGSGNAGIVQVDTKYLLLKNGGQISAVTYGQGYGGILSVNASDSIQIIGISPDGKFPSGLYFDSRKSGDAQGIKINTGILDIQNQGVITVSGKGTGATGNIQISASSILLNNQAKIEATNTSGSGSIKINTTGQIVVQNGSEVTVSGTGRGISGDLEITGSSIFLNNQGNLLAKTKSGEGGNIRLQAADTVLLRNNSNILTEALGTGNGGNITINAGNFVIAVLSENSDVAATAVQGRGGNIFVTAKGVFGFSLPERLVRTPESDISAASQLGISGTETINAQTSIQPTILPSQPLTALVDGRCQVGYQRRSHDSFEITNTNNLPLGYNHETNSSEADLRMSEATAEKSDRPAGTLQEYPLSPGQNTSNPNQLIEAQGFIVTPEGKVKLVEVAPVTTLYSSLQSTQTCATQQANSNH